MGFFPSRSYKVRRKDVCFLSLPLTQRNSLKDDPPSILAEKNLGQLSSTSHCIYYTQQAMPEAVAPTAGTAAEAATQRAAVGWLHLAPTHCAANPIRSDVSAITFAVGLLQGHKQHGAARHSTVASHGLQRPCMQTPSSPPQKNA